MKYLNPRNTIDHIGECRRIKLRKKIESEFTYLTKALFGSLRRGNGLGGWDREIYGKIE